MYWLYLIDAKHIIMQKELFMTKFYTTNYWSNWTINLREMQVQEALDINI